MNYIRLKWFIHDLYYCFAMLIPLNIDSFLSTLIDFYQYYALLVNYIFNNLHIFSRLRQLFSQMPRRVERREKRTRRSSGEIRKSYIRRKKRRRDRSGLDKQNLREKTPAGGDGGYYRSNFPRLIS